MENVVQITTPFGINDMFQCGYCGMIHGPRCPSIRAIEYYPDGRVKRVEFFGPPTTGTTGSEPEVKR